MKTSSFKKLFGTLAIAGALVMVPSAFAETNASTTGSFTVNNSGIVHVKNAEVTSVSGNIVNAVSRFTNLVTSWVFTTNASTTIAVANATTSSTSNIKVGDKINVVGTLSALGSVISVNATKIVDTTSFALWKTKSGTVQSVNTANGTFVLKSDDKLITVQTNATTTFMITPTATSLATTTTLGGLVIGSKVNVTGYMNPTKTVLTASKVTIKPLKLEVNKENKKKTNGSNNGWKNGWKDKEDRTNNGEHKGFLKTNIGTNIGLGL